MWVVFCALFVIKFHLITSVCQYEHYDFDYPPVFTQTSGSYEFIVKSNRQALPISEGSYLKAYCDTNFSTPIFDRNSDSENYSTILVKCLKGSVRYVTDNRVSDSLNEAKLGCHGSQPSLYISGGKRCGRNTLLTYGLQVNHNQIVLANLCYDTNNEEISYIHYDSGDRLTKLKDSTSERFYESANMPVNFIGSNQQRTAELNFYFYKNRTKDQNMFLYKFDLLVPAERLLKGFTSSSEILEGPSSIPWWTGLKNGNWRLFEDFLQKKTLSIDCEIYTGVLHLEQLIEAKNYEKRQREQQLYHQQSSLNTYEAQPGESRGHVRNPVYPSDWRNKRSYDYSDWGIEENDLHFMAGSVGKTIPLYVWTYMKPRSSDDEAVVVIAINTPFIQWKKYTVLQFCTDRCGEYEWLNRFGTAKMPALGYIFCCDPEEVRRYIADLP